MQAVILAGGLGTRLRPLTYEIPKSLVPISGRPFLHYVLEMLAGNGVTDIVICTGHLGQQIVDSVGDGSRLGCSVRYSVEKELLDTGGAIKNAEAMLDDEFLVLNGDTCHPIDYRDLLGFWRDRGSGHDALIVLYENRDSIVPNNARVDEQGNVAEYSKDGVKGTGYVDGGVQIFRKSVFRDVPAKTRVSLEKDIYGRIIEAGKMLAYTTGVRYYDIGTQDRIMIFEEYLRSVKQR
jgi:mannose-1-phosphate guanylyltransferase